MKKIIAFIVLFFWVMLSSADAQYQGWSSSIPGVEHFIVEYGDELNLTDEQKALLIEKSQEQRQEMQRPRSRDVRQRGSLRGERRGSANWSERSREQQRVDRGERPRRTEREERSQNRTGFIQDVLTDEQVATLQALQTERAEKQHEIRVLRHRTIVENADIDGNKVEEVITLLTTISEQHKAMQVQSIRHPGEWDREATREWMAQVRDAHNEIKNLLTAAEYEHLQRTIRPGTAFLQGRMDHRPAMRSR